MSSPCIQLFSEFDYPVFPATFAKEVVFFFLQCVRYLCQESSSHCVSLLLSPLLRFFGLDVCCQHHTAWVTMALKQNFCETSVWPFAQESLLCF